MAVMRTRVIGDNGDEEADDRLTIATETLATFGLPACVIDSGGRALAANDFIKKLMPRVVAVLGEQVCVANKMANSLLYQGLDHLNSREMKAVAPIPIPATETLPALILHLASTRPAHSFFRGTLALIVATPLVRPPLPSVTMLAILFGLAHSEARVAQGILKGMSVNQLTSELDLSAATVRSYLKSVFDKTGVHRQAELVSLLASAQFHNTPK